MLAKQAGGALSGDYTAQVLATLAPSTWSGDIVAPGAHLSDVLSLQYTPPGESPACAPGYSSSSYFPFSSGVYCYGKKRYFFANEGAHVDWDGSGVGYFDFTTGKWVQTETPTQYGHNPSDLTYVPSCSGVSPWGIGAYNGGAWPAESSLAWYCWPTQTPGQASPHFGAYVAHTYAMTEWCPDINLIHRASKGGFSDAAMNQGIWTINPDTGLWGQSPLQILLNGSGIPGSPTLAYSSNGINIWIPETKLLFSATGYLAGAGYFYDPIARTSVQSHITNPSGSPYNYSADVGQVGTVGGGCVIDDPFNPGHRAFVFFTYLGNYKPPFPPADVISCYRLVDVTTGLPHYCAPINFGASVPSALTSPSHNNIWFEGAKYKSGSTKIIVFDYYGTGFWLLDTVTWTFSGPIANSGIPAGWTTGQYRLIQPMDDYQDANYIPFCFINQAVGSPSPRGGGVALYKFPLSLL